MSVCITDWSCFLELFWKGLIRCILIYEECSISKYRWLVAYEERKIPTPKKFIVICTLKLLLNIIAVQIQALVVSLDQFRDAISIEADLQIWQVRVHAFFHLLIVRKSFPPSQTCKLVKRWKSDAAISSEYAGCGKTSHLKSFKRYWIILDPWAGALSWR